MSLKWIIPIQQPFTRLFILDSSFNPPTNAHLKMLYSIPDNSNVQKTLLISTENMDKGKGPIESRLTLMINLGFSIATCNVGKFVEKAKLFECETVFLMGYDTVVRFFDSKYYDDYEKEIDGFFKTSRILLFDRGRENFGIDVWERKEMEIARKYSEKIDLVQGFKVGIFLIIG
jgi:nicotinamide-nucleotide adenylyltransferase